ncbi:cutinase family protein [Rhodococcus sp. NPDC058521]|uniref:cutinase family protein n=1 Tax=Rhodococcus sp. NPDC058521 TaxID=3346536 RepID=UPI00365AC16A
MFRARVVAATAGVAIVAASLISPFAASAVPSTGSTGTGSTDPVGKAPHPANFVADCPDLLVVGIAGGDDSGVDRDPFVENNTAIVGNALGRLTVPTGLALKNEPGTVGWAYVPYPATYGLGLLTPVPSYQDSVAYGITSMNRILDDTKTRCGDKTKFALVGNSIGSEVASRVTQDIGSRGKSALVSADDVVGVALVGNPYRPAGSDSMGKPGPAGGGFMSSEPIDYGLLKDKVTQACRPLDVACDSPREIALLDLALGVLGQSRYHVLNPGMTISDTDRALTSMAARTVGYIVSHPEWIESDESLLDVLRKVSDRTYEVDEVHLTPQQRSDAVTWALGPGAEVVRAKLEEEGAGFVEDNRDIFDLVIKPYILFGYAQHTLYWVQNPFAPGTQEVDQLMAWLIDLAREQK